MKKNGIFMDHISLARFQTSISYLPPAARGTLFEKTAPIREASAKIFYYMYNQIRHVQL
jgi:hypothetical protein